jgi:hypothetical protein
MFIHQNMYFVFFLHLFPKIALKIQKIMWIVLYYACMQVFLYSFISFHPHGVDSLFYLTPSNLSFLYMINFLSSTPRPCALKETHLLVYSHYDKNTSYTSPSSFSFSRRSMHTALYIAHHSRKDPFMCARLFQCCFWCLMINITYGLIYL